MKPLCIIVTVLLAVGYLDIVVSSTQESGVAQEPHVISWFFVTKDVTELSAKTPNLADIIGIPGAAEIALLRQKENSSKVSGLIVLYAGRITYSDLNGQVILPLQEPTNDLMVFVTERPTPKIIHGNTVESWYTKSGYPLECFSLKRVNKHAKFIWEVERVAEPQKKIPYDAIIICIDPELIEIPVGTWPTIPGVNLILPNIYITGVKSDSVSALNTIAIGRFFRPTHPWFSYAPERYVVVTT